MGNTAIFTHEKSYWKGVFQIDMQTAKFCFSWDTVVIESRAKALFYLNIQQIKTFRIINYDITVCRIAQKSLIWLHRTAFGTDYKFISRARNQYIDSIRYLI